MAGWLALVALLELVTRALVYGMAPEASESSRSLGGQLGGPGFVAVLLVAVGLGALFSVVIVWLATMGVRERWGLACVRPAGRPPRVALRPVLVRALALTLVAWPAFAAVESAFHLQQGMGFHGIECLVGPVHRNALPVVAGLALLCSALLGVAGMVLAWMRRRVGALATLRGAGRLGRALAVLALPNTVRRAPLVRSSSPRGPPRVAV